MTREDLIRIARAAVAGVNRPDDLDNPMTFDPPEWVIDALSSAWKAGAVERKPFTTADIKAIVVRLEQLPEPELTDADVAMAHGLLQRIEARAGVTAEQLTSGGDPSLRAPNRRGRSAALLAGQRRTGHRPGKR